MSFEAVCEFRCLLMFVIECSLIVISNPYSFIQLNPLRKSSCTGSAPGFPRGGSQGTSRASGSPSRSCTAGVEELAGALEEDFRCLSASLGLLLLRVHDFLGHADDLDHRGRLGCLLRCVSRINVLILKLDQLFLDVYWGGPTFVIVKALLGVCPG